MPTIHKRRLVSGEVVWELTHGTGRDRHRCTVGKTREEAQEALNQFTRPLVLHREAPADGSCESALAQSVTPRTVIYELQVLRTFFRWAVMHNYLFVNPTVTIERLRIPRRALPKFLTSEQLTRLFAACNLRERRLFMTILLTGMRKGEVEH